MKYSVDRIENDIAVLETEKGFIEVSADLLPEDVREGSVLVNINGRFLIDADSETECRKRMFALQQKIKSKKL